LRVLLFLASNRGQWAVFGPHHTQEWWAYRLGISEATLKRALADLRKMNTIGVERLKYRTTYYLTEDFLDRCEAIVEQAQDLAGLAEEHYMEPKKARGELLRELYQLQAKDDEVILQQSRLTSEPRGGARLSPVEAQDCASLCREEHEKGFRRTAEAGRPDGRQETPMTDYPTDDDFYGQKPKRKSSWGNSAERVLGGSDEPAVPKTVKHSPPRRREILVLVAYFQSKLSAFSEARHVPLWVVAGRVNRNIDFLLRQGHTQDTIERAIDYFASQASGMMFQGTGLWEQFFAHREDAFKFAAVAGIGSRGGPREDLNSLAKRLSQRERAD